MNYDRTVGQYSFEGELLKGKECEKHFYDFFTNRGLQLTFVDKKDVDFEVVKRNGDIVNVDVKRGDLFGKYATDRQRMVVEDIQNIRINSPGWYRYDEDDLVIALDDIINHKFYLYKMGDLREYIEQYKNGYSARVMYGNLGNSKVYYVYIEKFYKWLQEHEKFNRVFFYA